MKGPTLKITTLILTAAILLTGCAKKKSITPEGEKSAESQKTPVAETTQTPNIEITGIESEVQTAVNDINSDYIENSSITESKKEPENLMVSTETIIAEKNDKAEEELPESEEIPTETS